MADLHVEVEHALGKVEAQTRIEALLGELRTKHAAFVSGVSEEWNGHVCAFTFTVKGAKVSGKLTVHDDRVVISGKYPWVLKPFHGKVVRIIRDRAVVLLS